MHFSSIWFWRYHHEDDKAFFGFGGTPYSIELLCGMFFLIIIILCLMVWYGTIWCGMISYGMRRYDAIWWCGMALDIWDDKTILNKLNMSIYTLSYQYTHHLSTRCHICTDLLNLCLPTSLGGFPLAVVALLPQEVMSCFEKLFLNWNSLMVKVAT